MSPVVEFTLSSPILQETRKTFAEISIQIEDERVSASGVPEMVVLITGDEAAIEAFEERLPTDPSIERYELLSDFGEGKLVQLTLSDEGFRGMTYPIAVNLGITFLQVEAKGKRMRYRAQAPTLEALSSYREHCADRNLDFKLINLSQTQSLDKREYGLTPRQREVLLHALDAGYFEVPRQTSLEELAAEFEISDQALSALLRRGQNQLLRHTLGAER